MLIIGQGPAGVSASLYALRAGLDVILVGKGAGALEKAHMIENYYGLEKPLSGSELFEVGKKQAECFLFSSCFVFVNTANNITTKFRIILHQYRRCINS